ncbi:MAG: hypothetical protein NTY08_07330 [Proteobacteria bacterium]|nr:hypothetical protein [Pseudomonadota bacterium]
MDDQFLDSPPKRVGAGETPKFGVGLAVAPPQKSPLKFLFELLGKKGPVLAAGLTLLQAKLSKLLFLALDELETIELLGPSSRFVYLHACQKAKSTPAISRYVPIPSWVWGQPGSQRQPSCTR